MSSREFLVLLPPRLGGLDLIIPMLFDWAAKPGGFHRIHFIFPSNNLFHNLNQNPVLMNAYQAMSCNKVVMHSSKIFRNSFSILEILKLAISLWLKCLFGKS